MQEIQATQIETDFFLFLCLGRPPFLHFARANEVCVHDDFRSHHIKLRFLLSTVYSCCVVTFVIVHSFSVRSHGCIVIVRLNCVLIFLHLRRPPCATLIYARINLYVCEARVCFHNDM